MTTQMAYITSGQAQIDEDKKNGIERLSITKHQLAMAWDQTIPCEVDGIVQHQIIGRAHGSATFAAFWAILEKYARPGILSTKDQCAICQDRQAAIARGEHWEERDNLFKSVGLRKGGD